MPATHTSSDDSDDPQTQPPHSSQTPGSQPIDSQSQPNWILKNASMRILGKIYVHKTCHGIYHGHPLTQNIVNHTHYFKQLFSTKG